MTPERQKRVQELYEAVCGVPASKRSALLQGLEPETRAEVEMLLARDASQSEETALLSHASGLLATATIFTPGTQLGPYRIEQQIGAGGMGEVFRATDTRLGRIVAIKTCRTGISDRFQREARAISALNHPNICSLYDVGPDYLVMEYVEGPTLADLIKKGPLDHERARRIALQTAEAVEAAHEKGIVHRDLKPGNIIVRADGVSKVLDFGLSKAIGEAHTEPSGETTQVGTILGTPAYMSPEQASGGQVDRRSDIWSFGVLVTEMVTGKRPFTGSNTSELLSTIIRDQPNLSSVPPPWAELVRRCLTKEVRSRLQSIGDARILLEEGLTQPATPAAGHPTRRTAVAAVGALGVGLGAGWLAKSHFETQPENLLTGAKFTPITDFPGAELQADISPNGQFVVFVSDRDGPFDIFLTQPGTYQFSNLTQGKYGQLLEPTRSTGFSGDGNQIWFRGATSEAPNTTPIRLMPILGGPVRPFLTAVSVSWSPDGTQIAYHHAVGDPIFVADSNGGNAKQIFQDPNPGGHCHYPIWSPDGRWIYFVRGNPTTQEMDLWRIAPTGGEPQRMTARNLNLAYPAFLNNDTLLFVSPAEDGSGPWLYALDIPTRRSSRLTYGLDQYTSVAASANGRRLVATVSKPSAGLWTIPFTRQVVKESEVKRFPVPSVRALAPRFAGKDLFYLSSLGGGDGLWRFSGTQSQEVWRGSEGALLEAPAVSPDFTRVAILLRRGGRVRLYLINADGTGLSEVAPMMDVRGSVSWSPDGRWIAAGGLGPRGAGLYKIPVDGGDPQQIHKDVGTDAIWSSDNQAIAFTALGVGRQRPLLAVHPDGTPVPLPEIEISQIAGERFRFTPDGKGIVYIEGLLRRQNLRLVDIANGKSTLLTDFDSPATMRTFDFTADGKQIVFDRQLENSNIMMIDLPDNKR